MTMIIMTIMSIMPTMTMTMHLCIIVIMAITHFLQFDPCIKKPIQIRIGRNNLSNSMLVRPQLFLQVLAISVDDLALEFVYFEHAL